MSKTRRIFVAWDSTVEKLRKPLERLQADPNLDREDDDPVLTVEVPMLAGRGGELWNDYVASEIEKADALLAFLDTPNANVAFEVGYALGRGIDVWLVYLGSELPKWTREAEPFRGQLLRQVASAGQARELLRGRNGNPLQEKGTPPSGRRTIVLCPGGERSSSGSAQDTRELLRGDRAPFEPLGVSFSKLPEELAEVGRVIWLVLAYADGEDVRDGCENAALAAVAGFLHAHERELIVLREHTARVVADVDLECEEWRGEGLARLLDKHLTVADATPLSASKLQAAYRKYLQHWNERLVPFFGADSSKSLGEVYVTRRVFEDQENNAPAMGEARVHDRGRTTLTTLITGHAEKHGGAGGLWIIYGTPGSGKTTLVRRLCAELASDASGPVPVLLSLAHFAATRRSPFDVAEEDIGDSVAGLAGELAKLAQTGNVWLLLDGLDEVRPRDLLELPSLIKGFHSQFRRCPIVVTSRDEGRRDLGLSFTDLRLVDLERAEGKDLVERWLPGRGHEVWREIERHPHLEALARNPWMLTLMAKLAQDQGSLPSRRSELFENAVDLLLKRKIDEESRGVADAGTAADLMAPLALRLQRESGEAWSVRSLHRHVRRCCQDSAWPNFRDDLTLTWKGPEDFLEDIGKHSGLLAPRRGPSQPWEFVHRSLREFLAARAWAEMKCVEGERPEYLALVEQLAGQVQEEGSEQDEILGQWGETFVLLAGRLEDGDRCLELLRGLGHLSSRLAIRALPDVRALPREEALGFLTETDGWTGDDLALLLRGWIANGVSPDDVLAVVRPRITSALDLESAAAFLHAIESAELAYSASEFFVAWGRTYRPEDVELELSSIPGGEFQMGSPESEEGRDEDEGPAHTVVVPTFRLGCVPVTLAQLSRLTGADLGDDARLPATKVTWYVANLFSRWVGGRLPSEAEWEYACRAKAPGRFWSGDSDEDLARVAWFGGNSDSKPHVVGEKPCNAFGLHDMHGNVYEWCRDSWSSDYSESRRAHPGAHLTEAVYRVVRGGSFGLFAWGCRSAYRDWWHPSGANDVVGFRVALPAED
ncbi:MAG: SUMF1/EgtB/PvdO family nonheme iron enzyme [bacterium]|nr:SUMF1/EgtB/PvdO family nonheme iron enzyme [bacterium]